MSSVVKGGALGMMFSSGVKPRYCVLHTNCLDHFKDEAESKACGQPRGRVYFNEITSLQFVEACSEHNAGFVIRTRLHEVRYFALDRSSQATTLDEWGAAFAGALPDGSVQRAELVSEIRQHRQPPIPRANSPRERRNREDALCSQMHGALIQARSRGAVQGNCAAPGTEAKALPTLLSSKKRPARPRNDKLHTLGTILDDDTYDCAVAEPRQEPRDKKVTWSIMITGTKTDLKE
jgi:hypothetical protein